MRLCLLFCKGCKAHSSAPITWTWQIHEVIYCNDPELHFAKGGVVEALDKAKEQGKVRYVGFTGHKHPSIHLAMLSHNYPFDTVQMPLNCFDGTYRSLEDRVLPEVQRRGMGALGMKSLGGDGQPLLHGIIDVEEGLRYAMSLPVASTISGIDSLAVLRQNLAIARGFQRMNPLEMQALRQRCAAFAADGHWSCIRRLSNMMPQSAVSSTDIFLPKSSRSERPDQFRNSESSFPVRRLIIGHIADW